MSKAMLKLPPCTGGDTEQALDVIWAVLHDYQDRAIPGDETRQEAHNLPHHVGDWKYKELYELADQYDDQWGDITTAMAWIREGLGLPDEVEVENREPIRLFMYWGYDFQRSEYSFDTEAEKQAFMQGVAEGDGWQKYLSAELNESYEVVHRIDGYWENRWTDPEHDDEEPLIFDNYTTAEKALNEHFADADAAKLDYDRRDFNIVPVGHF